MPRVSNSSRDTIDANLVELVQGHQRVVVLRRGQSRGVQQSVQHDAMIEPQRKSLKTKARQDLTDRDDEFGLHDRRGGTDRIDIALIELAEPSARGTIGAPHRLDLIPLEELRQLVLILRDDSRERHGQIVPQREIGLTAAFMLATLENLENELVAFFAVLPQERLDVLERRRFERLEPVPLVHFGEQHQSRIRGDERRRAGSLESPGRAERD